MQHISIAVILFRNIDQMNDIWFFYYMLNKNDGSYRLLRYIKYYYDLFIPISNT